MRLLVIVILLASSATAAFAQANPQAEDLFRQGRQAMETKHFAEACQAFEGSQRLEPMVATLMNLADCREKNGQLATAWGLFLDVVRQVRDDAKQVALRDVATKRAAALEGRLSRLTINVPETSRIEGLRILRNGTAVDPATWNRSLPIDGGTYEIAASAPGVQPWSAKVTVGVEGDSKSVDVPRFEPVVDGGGRRVGGTETQLESTTGIGVNEQPRGAHRMKPLALALGGLAAVAGGVAVVFELQGRSALDDARNATTQAEQDKRYDDANGKHHLAQGLAIGTGACAVAAVVVWMAGRTSSRPATAHLTPVLGPNQAGLAFGGAF